MRERLYLAGYPTTPLGWAGFSLMMALGIAGTLNTVGLPGSVLVGVIVLSWLINLAVVHWPWQSRFLCHAALWVIIWRSLLPEPPWYRAIAAALLLAGAVIWEQERRRNQQGPA